MQTRSSHYEFEEWDEIDETWIPYCTEDDVPMFSSLEEAKQAIQFEMHRWNTSIELRVVLIEQSITVID